MKGKETVEKPKQIQTPQDVTDACRWCEQQQDALSGRIMIDPDTFNPALRIQRATAFLWSKQVTQDADGVCDSPYLSLLETRCRNHCSAQMLDFDPAIHVADVAAHVAEGLYAATEAEARKAAAHSNDEVSVDESAIGGLNAEDRASVVAHDAGVQRAKLQARADALAQECDQMQALVDRAVRVRALLVDGCNQHMARCQHTFREQALRHLRWAHKPSKLKSPYVLPGTLEELPEITLIGADSEPDTEAKEEGDR